MPQLVVANSALLRLIWSRGGELYALNVMGVVNSTSVVINQALANTLGTAIKAALTSSGLGAQISGGVAIANVGLRDIRSANTAEFIDAGAPTGGTAGGDPLPPQIALCITLRTAQAGRSFRGRSYIPGFAESVNNVSGQITSAVAGVDFIAAIQSALVAQSLNLGVLSRPREAPLTPSAGFITPVTSIVARDSVWDTQRRRAIPGI